MSSPVLSDLPRFHAARQALHLSSNSAWNSVQTAVLKVFQEGELLNNELYTLNENIRHLLKSELGSFITDYFQNQLLAKGLLLLKEKVIHCEGDSRIVILSEIWDHFFTEILPTLQAIFYPVQGQELTIRQIALLGFRDLVLLKLQLEELLPRVQHQVPPSIVQMLLVLQGIHEPNGPSEGYLQLEQLVREVVSPYLGTYGVRSFSSTTCTHERQASRSGPKVVDFLNHSPQIIISKHSTETALTPVIEQEGEAYLEKCGGVRRHTVANAHSDIQLLAMTTMVHSPMGEEEENVEQCILLQPSLRHRHCSSEPNIAEPQRGLVVVSLQETNQLDCTTFS